MTAFEVAQKIDISAVRTHHTMRDIEEIVAYAKQYKFINVHVLPSWIKVLAPMIADEPDVYVGAPCGFPSGAATTETKIIEAQQMILDGVEEMDIVMNVGKFKNKEYDYVAKELAAVLAVAPDYVKTKVILEINCLTDEEMLRACEMVIDSGADFIKTGTGWVPGDANIERIRKIKQATQGRIKVKAAGGIRTREEFDALLDMGVERFGINTASALSIVESFDK